MLPVFIEADQERQIDDYAIFKPVLYVNFWFPRFLSLRLTFSFQRFFFEK